MAKIYDEKVQELHEMLAEASSENGATILIPNLQRPYVWTPNQVILLVDSLIRGWPFGTLLLWKVHHLDLATIPSRTFWKVVDRTGSQSGAQVSKQNPPGEFRMVLDGQQRLQSLLLALGGDDWGFRLEDREWMRETTGEKPKGRPAARHWSFAHVSFDLAEFKRQYLASNNNLLKIDFRDVLRWVVHDPLTGQSTFIKPARYNFPIPSAVSTIGKYIRFSRLWQLAGNNPQVKESFYKEKLKVVLAEHLVETTDVQLLLTPLAELMTTLRDVKLIKVAYLEVARFDKEVWDPDVYQEAIVNIFTRLNTAGRTLTREEITFAWIKTGWERARTAGKEADVCFEELRSELKEQRVDLQIDELVGSVSMAWAILYNKGLLLTDRDLLKGESVRPMAMNLCESWEVIVESLRRGAICLEDLGITYGATFNSINAIAVLWSWIVLAEAWAKSAKLSVTEKDAYEKLLEELLVKYSDRWILLSQWAGRWGMASGKLLAQYAHGLAQDWNGIRESKSPEDVLETLRVRMEKWLDDLKGDATTFIQTLSVEDRNAVRQYFVPLWLWHRLDAKRWEMSQKPLKHDPKKKTIKSEVDHVVACDLWQDWIARSDQTQDVAEDDVAVINQLGNCILLEKSFNISKGKRTLRSFLQEVHEFKAKKIDIDDWASAMALPQALLDPNHEDPNHETVDLIRDAIEERSAKMKRELIEYVQGTRPRADGQ